MGWYVYVAGLGDVDMFNGLRCDGDQGLGAEAMREEWAGMYMWQGWVTWTCSSVCVVPAFRSSD